MDMANIHCHADIGSYTLFHSSPEETILNLILFDFPFFSQFPNNFSSSLLLKTLVFGG